VRGARGGPPWRCWRVAALAPTPCQCCGAPRYANAGERCLERWGEGDRRPRRPRRCPRRPPPPPMPLPLLRRALHGGLQCGPRAAAWRCQWRRSLGCAPLRRCRPCVGWGTAPCQRCRCCRPRCCRSVEGWRLFDPVRQRCRLASKGGGAQQLMPSAPGDAAARSISAAAAAASGAALGSASYANIASGLEADLLLAGAGGGAPPVRRDLPTAIPACATIPATCRAARRPLTTSLALWRRPIVLRRRLTLARCCRQRPPQLQRRRVARLPPRPRPPPPPWPPTLCTGHPEGCGRVDEPPGGGLGGPPAAHCA